MKWDNPVHPLIKIKKVNKWVVIIIILSIIIMIIIM